MFFAFPNYEYVLNNQPASSVHTRNQFHTFQQILNVVFPFTAVLGFFLFCGIVLLLSGESPYAFYLTILKSGFSSFDEFAGVLFYATPLIFTGLAVALAFKAGLFNIGCEGQLYVAAFTAAWFGIHINLPSIVLIPLCIVAAMLSGAIWGAIPGLLKVKFGAHEVINTIMMNFIALALTNFLVVSVYLEPGQETPQTEAIHKTAQFQRLGEVIPFIRESNLLDASFLLAILCVILTYLFLKYSRWGYELRLVGNASEVAAYGGIKPGRVIVWTMALSGAIAGLSGVSDVMGYRYRYLDSFSSKWGFTGIVVALLGRNHPFGVFAASLLFGLLNKVALDIELLLGIPRGLFLVGQGLLIIIMVCIEGFIIKRKR